MVKTEQLPMYAFGDGGTLDALSVEAQNAGRVVYRGVARFVGNNETGVALLMHPDDGKFALRLMMGTVVAMEGDALQGLSFGE